MPKTFDSKSRDNRQNGFLADPDHLLSRSPSAAEPDLSVTVSDLVSGLKLLSEVLFYFRLTVSNIPRSSESAKASISPFPFIAFLSELSRFSNEPPRLNVEVSPFDDLLLLRITELTDLPCTFSSRLTTYAKASGFKLERNPYEIILKTPLRFEDTVSIYSNDERRLPFTEMIRSALCKLPRSYHIKD